MIPLGPGPIPSDPQQFAERLRTGIRRIFALSATAPVGVDVEMSTESRIEQVSIDLTSLELSEGKAIEPGRAVSANPSIVENLAVVGSPVLLKGLPVTMLAEASSVPVTWTEADGGELWIIAEDRAEGATAQLNASAEIVEIERAVGTELATRVKDVGFTLKSHSIEIGPAGSRGLVVRAEATVGKSFLSAKVNVNAQASIDDSMTLTISQVEVTSGNPIVGALLGTVNATLRPWNGRTIDLAAYSFAGAHLRDVQLTVDSKVRVRAQFG